MSRLIVKNIPNTINTEKLKEIFSQKGHVTDVQLKYTKEGKFRNFGFIGYKTNEQAAEARQYFDGTCINSMKITVEECAALGDSKKPRAWSKYAADSSANMKSNKIEETVPKRVKKKKRTLEEKVKDYLKAHKDDPLFMEFIDAHVNEKTAWIKDALNTAINENDSDQNVSDDDKKMGENKEEMTEESKGEEKIADKAKSDFEYMAALIKKANDKVSDGDKTDCIVEDLKPKRESRNIKLYHVKLTGLPYKCKKRDIKDFFRPLVPFTIRFPFGGAGGGSKKVAGFCFVGFRSEEERKKALFKDKLFIGAHRIHIQTHENAERKEIDESKNVKKQREEASLQNEESIGESGKIFIRNLPYIVTEQELTGMFEKYGPIAEINMPIDKVLRQPKGFATITYMIPENAVKAYAELDGTIFCGRMLHLLPGKQEDKPDVDTEGLSFKQKKALKLKSESKSSHNWNSLFLGANAVADVVADIYQTSKETLLLDNSKKTSAAVRMALGETQIVAETKAFLEENGVVLDAFNDMSKKRSKTCILVKNLPAHTTKEELEPLFTKFGPLARFVMPTHCITALVDFIEPSEARNAFTKLAYSQFKSSPLYLEWAPENVFSDKSVKKIERTADSEMPNSEEVIENKDVQKSANVESEKDVDEEAESDSTIFVKNLNFKTTEDDLRKHFSQYGKLKSVLIAMKKDPKKPGAKLSMGYGFVQFMKRSSADAALKELQASILHDKTLELKRSEKGKSNEVQTAKKSSKGSEQNGSKILIRNIPFQANREEIHEIFRAFGEIKSLRIPKKMAAGEDRHRGFGFIEYHTKSDAKAGFDALSQSTHLYGRRLVLEWAQSDEANDDVEEIRKRTAQSLNTPTPGGKRFRKGQVDVDTFVEADQ